MHYLVRSLGVFICLTAGFTSSPKGASGQPTQVASEVPLSEDIAEYNHSAGAAAGRYFQINHLAQEPLRVYEYDLGGTLRGEAILESDNDPTILSFSFESALVLGKTLSNKVRIKVRSSKTFLPELELPDEVSHDLYDYTLGGGTGGRLELVRSDFDASRMTRLENYVVGDALINSSFVDTGRRFADLYQFNGEDQTDLAADGSSVRFGFFKFHRRDPNPFQIWTWDAAGNQIYHGGVYTAPGEANLEGVFVRFYDNDSKFVVGWQQGTAFTYCTDDTNRPPGDPAVAPCVLKIQRFSFPDGTPLGPIETVISNLQQVNDDEYAVAEDGSIVVNGAGTSVLDRVGPDNTHFDHIVDFFPWGIWVGYMLSHPTGEFAVFKRRLDPAPFVAMAPFVYAGCGNGVVDASLSETCDDANFTERDGCASDCTVQICGNSILETGEECDDGNTTSGDGCMSTCLQEEVVAEVVGTGGTADSDGLEGDGATPSDPLETSVTVPSGGQVTIVETDDDGEPQGFSGLGKKVLISAPAQTVEDPLVISFTVDSSMIPAGESGSTVQVFRNGVRVLPCTGAPDAIPDPCISGIAVNGDDYVLTVLTSAASEWQLGFICGDGTVNETNSEECDDGNTDSGDGCSAGCGLELTQSGEQQKCLLTVTKLTSKVAAAQSKLNHICVKGESEGADDAFTCLNADTEGSVSQARTKWVLGYVNKCTAKVPDFGGGFNGRFADAVWKDFLADLIGDSVSINKAAAGCQQGIVKAADKYAISVVKAFEKCVKAGLKAGSDAPPAIRSLDGIEQCILADPDGKLAGAVLKLNSVRPKKCVSLNLSNVFQGDCIGLTGTDFDTCVETRANCAACRVAKLAHGLSVDCDGVDDGLSNQTCSE